MKATHRTILDRLEEYLSMKGSEHLRFTQALFNLGVNDFDDNVDFVFRDNHNDSDEDVLDRINKNIYK